MVEISFRLTKAQAAWIVWSIAAFVLAIIAVGSSSDSLVLSTDSLGFAFLFLVLEGMGVLVIGFAWILNAEA